MYLLNLALVLQGQSLESIEHLFAKPWSRRVNVLYYIRYIYQPLQQSGFYLGFEIGGGGGGGEAIVDNIAIGGGRGRGMCSLLRKARKLKHFMT